MKGRKPKPTKLKILTGNRGHQKLPTNEPQLPHGLPSCPRHLGGAGRAAWRKLAPLLLPIGASRVDAAALERVCSILARIQACERIIAEHGLTYSSATANGTIIRPRPEVNILATCERELRAMLCEFGLTPSSRCRIDLAKLGAELPKPDDSVSSFARKRG